MCLFYILILRWAQYQRSSSGKCSELHPGLFCQIRVCRLALWPDEPGWPHLLHAQKGAELPWSPSTPWLDACLSWHQMIADGSSPEGLWTSCRQLGQQIQSCFSVLRPPPSTAAIAGLCGLPWAVWLLCHSGTPLYHQNPPLGTADGLCSHCLLCSIKEAGQAENTFCRFWHLWWFFNWCFHLLYRDLLRSLVQHCISIPCQSSSTWSF